MDNDPDAPVEYPIDGVLDLHTFSPRDVKELIPAYIAACLARHVFQLRIIHGKGTGSLRETVHALLRRDERVATFRLDPDLRSSWGATLVDLKQTPPAS